MPSRKLVTALFLVTACAAVPLALTPASHRGHRPPTEVLPPQADVAAPTAMEALPLATADEAAAGHRALEAAAARTRDTQRRALSARVIVDRPEPQPTFRRHDRATVQAVERSVQDMTAVQGLYNAEATRKRAIDEILASPQRLAVFEDALKDEGYAKATFGSLQAETRYFASQALQQAARDGNDEPLIRAVKAINDVAGNGLSAGQKQDLEELLLGWARSKEPAFFESATDALPASLGFSTALPEDVRALYKDSVYTALYRRVGMDRAQQTVDRLFPS